MRRHPRGCRRSLPASLLAAGLLAAGGPAGAAVFTVGAGGAFPTIQAAVDAALAAPGANEVRVARGNYPENVEIGTPPGTLRVTGGWLPGFTRRDTISFETIVDGRGAGRPLQIVCDSGRVEVADLALSHGHLAVEDGQNSGGGVMAIALGSCEIDLVHDLLSDNTIERSVPSDLVPQGAGLYTHVGAGARVVVQRSTVFDNHLIDRVEDGMATLRGAGIYAYLTGTGTLVVEDDHVHHNTVETAGRSAGGGGLYLQATEGARMRLVADRVNDDEVRAPSASGIGVWLVAQPCTDCDVRVDRLEVRNHRVGSGDQLRVEADAFSQVWLADSLVARGSGDGIGWRTSGAAYLTNVTVAGHPAGTGLAVAPGPGAPGSPAPRPPRIANTLLFGNDVDLGGPAGPSSLPASNLVGVDPSFVDGAGGDFHLAAGSVAIDAGDDTPRGGLGAQDLDGNPRIQGARVDVGAYEASGARPPGHVPDPCRLDISGAVPFVPATAPVCACLRDAIVRGLGCGFFLPGLVVDFEVPGIVFPGRAFDATWTAHPWGGVEGPYRAVVSLVVGDQVTRIDEFKGRLRAGKDERKKFRALVAPELPARLRVRLEVTVPGLQETLVGVTGIELPALRPGEEP